MTREKWGELHTLIDALLEGELTEVQAERLNLWLTVDDDAQKVYVQSLDMHANLLWDHDREAVWPVETIVSRPPAVEFFTTYAVNVAADQSSAQTPQVSRSSAQDSRPEPISRPRAAERPTDGRAGFWRRCFGTPQLSLATSICVLLLAFTVVAAGERIIRAILSAYDIRANYAGGAVISSKTLWEGSSFRGTRRIGSSYYPGIGLANVLVFRLPALQELERLRSARLEWTYKARNGQPNFSIDLYGLGYVSSTSSLGGCFWEGDRDTAPRSQYGMKGPRNERVSLVAKSAMTPNTSTGRIIVEGPVLARFVQSLYDEGAQEGDLAVFRLNADASTLDIARETGYEVVHPPEVLGKTSPAEFPSLHLVANRTHSGGNSMAEAVLTAHGIESHRGLTAVNSAGGSGGGNNSDGTRRVGSSALPNRGLANTLVFRLPSLGELERVRFARLEWTYKARSGRPDFAVDLYGLGYMPSISMSMHECFWEGARDTRLRAEYGMESQAGERVSLIARGVMTPYAAPGRIVVEGAPLVAFLQSLYEAGAKGGELVVFRLNADASTLDIDRATGYEVVHPPEAFGKTTPSEFPILHLIGY